MPPASEVDAVQTGSRAPGIKYLVAVVQQRLHSHRDQLGDAVAKIDVVDVESGEAFDEFVAGYYRAAGRQDALGVGVALRIGQSLDHVAHDHVWCIEAEWGRVADVELEDAVSLSLQPRGMGVHRATDFVQDVLKLGRLRERTLPVMAGGMRRQLWVVTSTIVPSLSTDIC